MNDYNYVGASPPTEVTAVQDGPTSIRVTWTPPSPLGSITGYRIFYTDGRSNGTVDVSGGNANSYTLTGLSSGQTYTISIRSLASVSFSSSPVETLAVGLSKLLHLYVDYSVVELFDLHLPCFCTSIIIIHVLLRELAKTGDFSSSSSIPSSSS